MDFNKRYSRYFIYIKPIAKMPIVKNYSSTVFTIVTIIVFIFFAIKPTIETITVLQKKIDNAKSVLEKVNKKADDITKAKENYQKIDNAILNKIESALPNNVNFKSIVSTLEELARQYNATISALQIQPISITSRDVNSIGTSSGIDFTFNTEGSYKSILSILQQMQISSRVFSIDHVSINKASSGTNLIMSVNGKAFYIK